MSQPNQGNMQIVQCPGCEDANKDVSYQYRRPHVVACPGNPLVVKEKWAPLTTIKDSGERQTFSSGSMRDPATGKIKWSRITFGPMMRRWAQHLTTAEVKYPDPRPGVPNFTLIETDEEFFRYKESAFRHFMSWFFDETDEDHASAVYFNINGVEIIKDKRKNKQLSNNQEAFQKLLASQGQQQNDPNRNQSGGAGLNQWPGNPFTNSQ